MVACANGQPHNLRTTRGLLQRSAGAPDCPVRTGLSGAPISPVEQRLDMPFLEGDRAPDRLQDLSGGAPDCPMHHSTEGKDGLPSLSPTAPSCLGAIKGTPRRMEEQPKHSLSILRLQDSNFTHSILCDSDLSST
jgi:hypothetical protein